MFLVIAWIAKIQHACFFFSTRFLPPLGWKDSPSKLLVVTYPISFFLLISTTGEATSKQVNMWLQHFFFFWATPLHFICNHVNQCNQMSSLLSLYFDFIMSNAATPRMCRLLLVFSEHWTSCFAPLLFFASVPIAIGLLCSLFQISLNQTPSMNSFYLSVSQSLLKRKRSVLLIVRFQMWLAAGEHCDIDCVAHTGAYTKVTVGIIVLALTSGRVCKTWIQWRHGVTGSTAHTPDQWLTHNSK